MENKQVGICPVCHRTLRSPKSIERGMGSVCSRKEKERTREDGEQLELKEDEE